MSKDADRMTTSWQRKTQRTNSNGEDVAATVTCSHAKGSSNYLSECGGYVIEKLKWKGRGLK